MTNPVPLPRPGSLGLIQYAGVDMHKYAAAQSAADNAALQKDYFDAAIAVGTATQEIAALREALAHVERVMGPVVPPCCDGCNFEWGEALKTVRAARRDAT